MPKEAICPILSPDVSTWSESSSEWTHNACGSALMGLTVTLSHRIGGGMPLAGNGSTERMVIPYCPTCDDPPPPKHGELYDDGRVVHPSVSMVEVTPVPTES